MPCDHPHEAGLAANTSTACGDPAPCAATSPQAVLGAVKNTFTALKHRLGSKAVGGVFVLERPLFGVELQLRLPSVVINPSLEEIQETINSTAKKVGGWRGKAMWWVCPRAAAACRVAGPADGLQGSPGRQ